MSTLIDKIDALLPQTQCRDCDYDDCRSYATAITTDNEAINKCLPGGEVTMERIATLLQQDPEPHREAIQANTKDISLAIIREDECIGCTKCIQACPVDAIIGASKQMHTIITDACNGCELCLPPCPVDCIDLIQTPMRTRDDVFAMADQSRQRYQTVQQRQQEQQQLEKKKHQQAKLQQASSQDTLDARKKAIAAAMQRAQQKREVHE